MASKTILIGLDGAEPTLLKEWASQGLLPNIATVFENWYHRSIDTADGFGDGVFWNSLITGVGLAEHGRYFSVQYNPKNCELNTFSLDSDFGQQPFWYYASKAGARVAIMDMFLAPLCTGLNGIQVADWMTHDRTDEPRSWPASFIDMLNENYGTDPLGGESDAIQRNAQEWLNLHQGLVDRLHNKTRACKDMLENNDWDLFCVNYCEPHDIGHQSWHWHDSTSPNHPHELVAKHGNPVLQTYQALDNAIGQLLTAANANNIYFVAGQGMDLQSAFNSIIQKVLGHYCGQTGDREALTDNRRNMPYFEVPHNMNAAAIRVNLAGRDAYGVVAQEDYKDCLNELIEKLEKLTDADTGESIVEKIVNVHQQHQGKRASSLPDLLVCWKKPLLTKTVRVDENTCFDLQFVFGTEFRAGDHTENALFASNKHYQNDAVKVEAIAPTICRSLGVNLPCASVPALELIRL